MKVEELVLDGFKSYAVRTVISSWDPQFNAITGLNGSGKSNILDAICFVLGISSMSTVRAANLQDLIYKRGQAGVTKASVTITFDNSDKSKSPIGFEQYSKISISRQVLLGGTSKYLINGHKVQQSQILNLLQSVQLNINNPNFLIMQGKITKMLNMKPTEILGLVEEAAGTKMYEGQREKAERIMAKKNIKLETTENLLKEEVEPKLRHLREQKRTVMEFQDIIIELETLSKAVAAHDYQIFLKKLVTQEEVVEKGKMQVQQLESKAQTLESEIATLEEDLKDMRARKQNEIGKGITLKELEATETELTNLMTRTVTARDLKSQILEEENTKLKNLCLKLDKQKKLQNSSDEAYNNAEMEFNRRKTYVENLTEQLRQREDLLSALSTGLSSKGSTDGGFLAQLHNSKQKLSRITVEKEKSRYRIDHLRNDISSKEDKIKSAKDEVDSLNQKIKIKEDLCTKMSVDLERLGFFPEKVKSLKDQEKNLNHELYRLRHRISEFHRAHPNLLFEFDAINAGLDSTSVKGLVGELFTISELNNKSTTAIEVCAGGRLYNVIVDTEKSGSKLLDKGNLRRRVTIIPLNKITSKTITDTQLTAAKSLAPGKVELALNLIEHDPEYSKAMQFIFGNRLICQDPETAKRVTFDPKIRTASITLDGDIYDPEGRLSGGSRQSTSSILAAFAKLRNFREQERHLLSALHTIQKEIQQQEILSKQTGALQRDLEMEIYQKSILLKQLEHSEAARLLQRVERDEAEIKELEKQIQDLENEGIRVQAEIESLQNDMRDFDNDGEGKLRALRQEINELSVLIDKEKMQLKLSQKGFQQHQIGQDELQSDLHVLEKQIEDSEKTIMLLKSEIKKGDEECDHLSAEIAKVRNSITQEKSKMVEINDELQEMTQTLNQKREEYNEVDLNLRKQRDVLTSHENLYNSLKEKVNRITAEQEWVSDRKLLNQVLEQYPNINLEHCHKRIEQLKSRSSSMKKKGVNSNIMAQIEQHEKHESSLRTKIRQINKDKAKIEETVRKLDDYKRTELLKTYKKVSDDFGQIFGDLLPQAYAKLVPTDPNDVTKGLEVRVKLGNVWKESLVELSGGQRSLVALSLIMSFLQFKPAPMYILDEVDAALDLSHTQNIGHLIKTRFKGSQFIVVSLKEGMFTNANRLFKVRFQEGTSVVTAS
ncbi:hypothetical protein KL925_000222 [Ogataea polymorpha]|nr:hypothetical protein KL937_004122 [Ogataea polymorpha]KAG7890103.1 hypothetical protein KL908_004441 [Ogataea polymorpha]KAG7898737.1 hypothetical protein KL935_004336 [Ogataea polymorpha]KAG7901702.1 hypothetical protein KL907_004372 [Ogataea polymorpha]KAG7907200.1 hypothetical protein KL906_004386 [Ogataea polymorpha]